MNGTFVVCIEQLEHAVHIIAIYLGWKTETVQLSEQVLNQEISGFSLFATVGPWINILLLWSRAWLYRPFSFKILNHLTF